MLRYAVCLMVFHHTFMLTPSFDCQTVMKSIAPWTELRHIDSRLEFHTVLDGGSELAKRYHLPSFVHINEVPDSYKPSRAMYKARALEYFRRHVCLEEKDWVLHLDEETQLDAYAIKAVLDFIERGDRQIAMVCRY